MVLQNNGSWHQVLICKYLKNHSMVAWLRGKNFNVHGVSVIRKGFLHTISWLGKCLSWKVGNGQEVLVGIDLIIRMQSSHILPMGLRYFLEDLGITTILQAHNIPPGLHQYWYTAEDLCVAGEWKNTWDNYTRGIEYGRIRLNSQLDSLV